MCVTVSFVRLFDCFASVCCLVGKKKSRTTLRKMYCFHTAAPSPLRRPITSTDFYCHTFIVSLSPVGGTSFIFTLILLHHYYYYFVAVAAVVHRPPPTAGVVFSVLIKLVSLAVYLPSPLFYVLLLFGRAPRNYALTTVIKPLNKKKRKKKETAKP